MPCDQSVLGFSNRWYKPGIGKSIHHLLPSGTRILIFSIPYFLACKIEAFICRGENNFYYSKDIEDVVILLDGCATLLEQVQKADAEVKFYKKLVANLAVIR